jgi:hypothetical protein
MARASLRCRGRGRIHPAGAHHGPALPNRLLAWERLQRAGHEELAHRVRAEMAAVGSDTGLTANTVRRWKPGTAGQSHDSASTW